MSIKTFLVLSSLLLSGCETIKEEFDPARKDEPWRLAKVVFGSELEITRFGKSLILRLCGVWETEGTKAYLQSLVDKKAGTIQFRKTKDAHEVWLETPEGQYHLNSWLIQQGQAMLTTDYTDCPSAETLALAQQLAEREKLGVWQQ